MRLWTIHPRYLDPQGLVALWREALLAQKVLRGETKGYRHHPQLIRFRETSSPLGAIGSFLAGVYEEACQRGYSFDAEKIGRERLAGLIEATAGQMAYEWRHYLAKIRLRSPEWFERFRGVDALETHPLFTVVPGRRAAWEVLPHRTPGRSRSK